MLAIDARAVRKQYGNFHALAGVDLAVDSGEIFSLLGPNGAGKTTLVEICEGFRKRNSGEVAILGTDPARGDAAWRSRIGVVLQTTSVFNELSVEEVIDYFASLYPSPLATSRILGMVGMEEKRHARCGKLSGGQKRRVDLAIGIAGDPELIFLDEPTTGLDPQARRQIWGVVREFASLGKTILLTTHYLEEAEALADHVGVIIAGKMVESGPPATLGGRENALAHVTFRRTGPLADEPLPEGLGDVTTDPLGLVTIVTPRPTELIRHLSTWAERRGDGELPGLVIRRPSLEEIYLDMIARHSLDSAGGATEGAA